MVYRGMLVRLCYRHGFPFVTSIVLAAVTAAWPRIRETHFHEGTSIWMIAILAAISTAFVLLCGGPFRTFFITIAVAPPFLIALPGFVRSEIHHPDYPISGFVEYFVFFVVAPILLTWIAATLLDSKEQSA